MDKDMSLNEFYLLLRKKRILLITVFLSFVLITGVISYFFLTPKYEATTQLLINQKEKSSNRLETQDIQSNLQIINTYNVIIKSPVILDKVIENLSLLTTSDLLAEEISVTNEQNSQVLNISVEHEKLKTAVATANMTADVFQEEIKKIMSIDNVTVLSPALEKKSVKPIKPNLPLNLIISSILGVVFGVGLAYFLYLINTTVKTEEDIEELIDYPLLGIVSPINTNAMDVVGTQRKRRRREKSDPEKDHSEG